MLDNREIAWLICLVAGGSLLAWRTGAAKGLGRLLPPLLSRPVLSVLGIAASYIALCVGLLSLASFWQWSDLKTTLFWAGGFALLALVNFQKIEAGRAFVRAVLLESVGINAFLSFITASHTFGLWLELALTSSLILLGLTYAVAERDEKLKSAKNFASVLFAALALLQLANSGYHIVIGLRSFATLDTAREFFVPIILTLMFLPFLYGLYVYTVYERAVAVFRQTTSDPLLRAGILRKLVIGFGLDTSGLEKWRRHTGLFPPEIPTDVDSSIAEIRAARRRERQPYRVEPAYGWLPNHATRFLTSAGLPTNDYHRSYDGWSACSLYRELGHDLLPNNLAYYIDGDQFVVSQLKVMLNINTPTSSSEAYESFFETVRLLARSAVPGIVNFEGELSLISSGAPQLLNGYELSLKRRNWSGGIKGGHDLVFTIRIATAPTTCAAP